MKYNTGSSVVISGSMEVKKIIDSEIILGKEIYYTLDNQSYESEQIFLEYKNFTHLQNVIKVNNISAKNFVNTNLISEGLIRTFKIKKKKKFFGLF